MSCRSDDPMRNLDICSKRAATMRVSPRYVPLVECKSRKRITSCFTSTEQCRRDTSGSSISMSAPPPNRPTVTSGRDSSNSNPCDEPLMTEILMVSPCGSVRLAVCDAKVPSSLVAPDLSCVADELTAIVGGLGSVFGSVGGEPGTMLQRHIQHLTCAGGFAYPSSSCTWVPQLGQRIRMSPRFQYCMITSCSAGTSVVPVNRERFV